MEELMGQSPRIFQGELSDRELLQDLKYRLSHGLPFYARTINYKKDRSTYYVDWQIHPIRDAVGDVTHYVSIQRDVTQEIQSEKNFNHRLKNEIALASMSLLLLQPQTRFDVFNEALEQLVVFAGISSASVYSLKTMNGTEINRSLPTLEIVRFSHFSPMRKLPNQLNLQPEWVETLQGGIPLILKRTNPSVLEKSTLALLESESALLLGIRTNLPEFTNYFLLITEEKQDRIWTEEDILLMKTGANIISAYLERKAHMEELTNHRNRLEALIRERTQDLVKALDQAESAYRAKSDFLATMSHELRTPLNSIIGFTKLIHIPEHDTNGKKYLDYIHSSGTHLLKLINEILDMARMESGNLEIRWETLPLLDLLEQSIGSLLPDYQRKSLTVRKDFPPMGNLYVQGDDKKLKQVFLNLLSNAVKFAMPNTDIVIRVSSIERFDHEYETVSIANYGAGIPSKDRARIFEKFIQLDRDKSATTSTGTGLGLAIAKLLIEAIGGWIEVESEEEEGWTVFTVLIPKMQVRDIK